MNARSVVRSALASAGFELRRKPSLRWLREFDFRTIIDVGANVGQFAGWARDLFPSARIYSFEPLPDAYRALQDQFRGDGRFMAFQTALGCESGTATLNESAFTASSSLLPMADLHARSFPGSNEQRKIPVRIRRLDEIEDIRLEKPVLLKLDVQGYEDRVIAGAQVVLAQTEVIIAEVSFEQLYLGQSYFSAIHLALSGLGFSYHGSIHQLASPIDGRLLQADALFIRTPNSAGP